VAWAGQISERVPGARLVVAYRDKTEHAREAAAALAEGADPNLVLFERNVPDIHALIATSTAVIFPVDDLYGKVDLPIVLLEAMRFGTPVLALDEGPLASLHGALRLPHEPRDWLDAVARVSLDNAFRARLVEDGNRALAEHFAPALVAKKYEALYADLLGPR
jgi:phosphatidylinositol alpha-1,6-mannosyltransferase